MLRYKSHTLKIEIKHVKILRKSLNFNWCQILISKLYFLYYSIKLDFKNRTNGEF